MIQDEILAHYVYDDDCLNDLIVKYENRIKVMKFEKARRKTFFQRMALNEIIDYASEELLKEKASRCMDSQEFSYKSR